MKQWKRWIREDLKGLGLFLVLAGGLLYAILFWFGYHLTYDNTILPGGNFWLVGGEILLTGIVAAAVLAVLFRALSGGFCRTETPTVMPENKCTSTSAVSYTHLDVYKRQGRGAENILRTGERNEESVCAGRENG